MAWITLTEDDILTRLSGPELTAIKTAALAVDQENPLPDVLLTVTRLVRSKVAACRANTLGDGQTIPDELEAAAIAIARYYLADRLPVRTLMTEARIKAYDDAMRLLRDAAGCDMVLEQPTTATDEAVASAPAPCITPKTRTYRRADADGI